MERVEWRDWRARVVKREYGKGEYGMDSLGKGDLERELWD